MAANAVLSAAARRSLVLASMPGLLCRGRGRPASPAKGTPGYLSLATAAGGRAGPSGAGRERIKVLKGSCSAFEPS